MPSTFATSQMSPAVVGCSAATDVDLHLLFQAIAEAKVRHRLTGDAAIPLSRLVEAGLPRIELRRLADEGLIVWNDDGIALTTAGAAAIFGRLYAPEQGATTVNDASAAQAAAVAAGKKPVWHDDARELWLGAYLVKRFRNDAGNQRLILVAFQGQGWAPRIADPLPHGMRVNRKVRLRETLRGLLRGQNPLRIRFLADGMGGVRWQAVI